MGDERGRGGRHGAFDGGWRRDPEWVGFGHALGRLLRDRFSLTDEHAIVIVEGAGRYVQMHGVLDEEVYAEAASGEYGGGELTVTQHRRLRELGWSVPDDSEMRPGPANYWIRRRGRVDLYAVVLLVAATFAEVYGCHPGELGIDDPVRCGCLDDGGEDGES